MIIIRKSTKNSNIYNFFISVILPSLFDIFQKKFNEDQADFFASIQITSISNKPVYYSYKSDSDKEITQLKNLVQIKVTFPNWTTLNANSYFQ